MAHLHQLGHLLGCGGVNDAKGLLVDGSAVGGPLRGGVLGDDVVGGRDVFLADDGDKVGPGGLEVGGVEVVLGGFGGCQGEGGGRVGFFGVFEAAPVGDCADGEEDCG